jgi:isoquinoline 1-oxidoreductase
MSDEEIISELNEVERYELREPRRHHFAADRREFVQALGAGLVIAAGADAARGQRGGRRGRGRRGGFGGGAPAKLSERFHIGEDGVVTVMTTKVEVGQGARTQIAQAAAEELLVPVQKINVIMGDTAGPDDGGTAGSRTTPSTIPAVRRAAAAAREALAQFAAERLSVERAALKFDVDAFVDEASGKRVTLAELASGDDFPARLDAAQTRDVSVARVSEWRILGKSTPKVNGRDVVTGAVKYSSDMAPPDMLYGKVLRPPSLGATLESIDLGPAQQMDGVKAVRDGEFVGCTAKTSHLAAKAVEALAKTANWKTRPQVSSDELFDHLKKTATTEGSGWPQPRSDDWGDGSAALDRAAKKYEASFKIAYIAHAPMEPRAAVAEWTDGKLTVWTGSQQPGRVVEELSQALRTPRERIHVIVPETGGGFGGKHSGEAAVEAARLAKAAGKPVSLRWTREEEFTWAYARPAGLIEVAAGLDDEGKIHAWDFTNYNSGESALGTPYRTAHGRTRFMASESPLRQGSYRALASTANAFARESAMDELAELAGADPLQFRLDHLPDGRLKDVLEAAAKQFKWIDRRAQRAANRGVGLACGTEKGSFVAACAEVEYADGKVKVLEVCEAYECGAIMNPVNLRAQVAGAIVMGLGGALTEAIEFKDGKLTNPRFSEYHVPRMEHLPKLDIVLVNRPDLQSLGAGETPIIAVAPAAANALAHAAGVRSRTMPLLADRV